MQLELCAVDVIALTGSMMAVAAADRYPNASNRVRGAQAALSVSAWNAMCDRRGHLRNMGLRPVGLL